MEMNDRFIEFDGFDVEIYEHAKNNPHTAEPGERKYETSALPDWIDSSDIPVQKIEDIRQNNTAFMMFINQVRDRDALYQKAMRSASDAKQKIAKLERKASDRKIAVIIMTVAEIIMSIGVSGLFTDYAHIFWIVLAGGVLLTAVSLYLNFKE